MKKRDKIYDSPEYKQIKEHLPEILKELERDKGLSQYQIPEEWNGDFERIYQKECRKEHIKRRILATTRMFGAHHLYARYLGDICTETGR